MKNKKTYLYIILGVGLLVFLVYLIWRPEVPSVEAVRVQRGLFEDVIKSDGRFRSEEKYTITAFASGTLGRVEVKVGDRVTKNQRLVVLDWDYNVVIKSPIDGVISKVFRESAGPIVRGESILEIVNPKKLEVVVDLLTTESVRVKKGNLIRIENWGGDRVLEAVVTKKSASGHTKLSALGAEEERTEIIAELIKTQPDTLAQLGDNFHIDLTIVISKFENVLKIPVGALFKDNDKWTVYKVVDGEAHIAHIEIDNKNFEEALVSKGLNEGDLVILHPGDQIKDGMSVSLEKNP